VKWLKKLRQRSKQLPPVLERRFHESGASSAAAFKHRVGRSAYEIQNKIDQKVEEELEIARENELDEHLATVKRMKRMNQRLMRVEKMLCKVVGVPYVEEEEDKVQAEDLGWAETLLRNSHGTSAGPKNSESNNPLFPKRKASSKYAVVSPISGDDDDDAGSDGGPGGGGSQSQQQWAVRIARRHR